MLLMFFCCVGIPCGWSRVSASCATQVRLAVRKATDLERVSTSATFWIAAIRDGMHAPEEPAMLAVRARAEPVADVAAARSQGRSRTLCLAD